MRKRGYRMEIREHRLSFHLPLARDYVENYPSVAELFDYDPLNELSTHLRYKQLKEQNLRCNRSRLVDVLHAYNGQIGNHAKAMAQVERLRNPDSVVIIGGQQPGVLTGPLYTIYKVITILSLAKREELRLGVPVIPVFWIAGEDHDWDEVNHVFLITSDDRIQKERLTTRVHNKASISHVPFDRDTVKQYIDQFLDLQPRTEHTASLRAHLYHEIEGSNSYSQFFAQLLVSLFGNDGLVLIDSADPSLRAIEGEMFHRIVQSNRVISELLAEASNEVTRRGYVPQVESKLEHANLFLVHQGERVALDLEGDLYRLRNTNERLSHNQLLQLAESEPERLSCNVVTRPLMQEYLFPVLGFVAGPGEISYWALYRHIFHHLGMRLPIIYPRITMSLMERHVQRLAENYHLSFDDLNHHLDQCKEDWLTSQDQEGRKQQFDQVRAQIQQLYQPLKGKLAAFETSLGGLSEQNLARILDQVAYLERKTKEALEKRHQAVLSQFDRAKRSLMPNGGPQERTLNLYSFINKYGFEWWNSFKNLSFSVNHLHKEVRL